MIQAFLLLGNMVATPEGHSIGVYQFISLIQQYSNRLSTMKNSGAKVVPVMNPIAALNYKSREKLLSFRRSLVREPPCSAENPGILKAKRPSEKFDCGRASCRDSA